MTATSTSREAYMRRVLNGSARRVDDRVFKALIDQQVPMTRRQISVASGVPINAVPAAVLKLKEAGVVKTSHYDKDPGTGFRAEYLRASIPVERYQRRMDFVVD